MLPSIFLPRASGRARLVLCLLAVGALAACASVPPPKQELAVAQSALRDAENAGASTAASLELARARDKLSKAEAAMKADDNELARRLLAEAEVDARRAAARAQAARSEKTLAELRESIRALQEEAARRPATQ
jgi:hypothetical protein